MNDPTVYAIPVFILTMLIEAFVLFRGGNPYDAKDTAASLSGGIGVLVTGGLMKGATLALYGAIYTHRLFDIGTGALAWALLVPLEDLCYYAYHRASHEVRIFWAGHVAHHSSQRYTLATALRQSWSAPLLGIVFWMPLAFLGFRPEMILLMKSFSLLYQYWIHTETIRSLGPLELVMNTQSHHRVHHGSNPQYIDRNHAGIFIVWDRLFGTFEPEGEKVVYGLTKNIETHHPVAIQTHEFVAIARDVRAAVMRGSWRGALRAMVGSPATPSPDCDPRSRRDEGDQRTPTSPVTTQ